MSDAIEIRLKGYFTVSRPQFYATVSLGFEDDTHDEATMTLAERSRHRSAAAAASARRGR